MKNPIIDVIIPAYNEEKSIGWVIKDIPKYFVRYIIVVNNNSSDDTRTVAERCGAIVLDQPLGGYGNACLKGIDYLNRLEHTPNIVVFLDGDYSDFPEQIIEVVAPIMNDDYEMVIGSRVLGSAEKGALLPQQLFGNWLATSLIKWIYKYEFSDLGPFRAIKYDKLLQLKMKDTNYGWTAEMQIKAAKLNYKCIEVPVDYRKRIGASKVSGTLKGTIMAGYKILWKIFNLI